ncbi:MAG: hypothetical protein JSS00_03900 [Proteobacteria bacterium]|nr:hypothetical protein [Pseudomonadota bacterium]
MGPKFTTILTIAAVATLTWMGAEGASGEPASSPPAMHNIPQSLVLEQQDTLDRLSVLARHHGPVGDVARRYLDLFERHAAREREYILPPLTLLAEWATREVSPDDAWAMAMADRVRADREVIFTEHTQITDAANALLDAGRRTHDQAAIEFAEEAVRDSANDMEIQEPAVLMIGAYLHSRLATAH